MQIDNLSELGKDKMPPEYMIWDGTSDEIDDWIDRVISNKTRESVIRIDPSEIER